MLQRDELSGLGQDAQKAADSLKDRVEFTAKRVASMCDAVVRFRDALDKSKAKQTLAMGQAVTLGGRGEEPCGFGKIGTFHVQLVERGFSKQFEVSVSCSVPPVVY